ncbi:MAG: HD domain-containing protein [Oscillospiraceae bacterium]|nr:HD domain-containing protein [Oscillospiraceae bacterium]
MKNFNISEIANKITEAGGTLYLVGGAVRDTLLDKKIKDKDYCITGISSQKFLQLFPYAHTRGKSFEVFDIDNNEFAIARKEKKVGIGHKEFSVETGNNITIYDDLARRDITINSMAINVLTNEFIDPFNGKIDIKNKIIRKTSDAFSEDPLRVYRIARFAAQMQFSIDSETITAMNKLKSELSTLSAERVFAEFKLALASNSPSTFFNSLRNANVLDVHFKEIFDLIGSIQPEQYHPEGDSYNHTMMAVDYSTKLTNKLEYRFASLAHDLGKGITPKENYPHHFNHEKLGAQLVRDLGNRLKMPTRWIKCGKTAAYEHMKGGIFSQMKPSKKVDFIEKVAKSQLGLAGMEIVVKSDRASSWDSNPQENAQLNTQIDFFKIGTKMLNEINGEYIKKKYNISPSIRFGEILRQERISWMKKMNIGKSVEPSHNHS